MYSKFFKRFFDFILSFLSLVLASPFLLVLIVLGAIMMKGNPFFAQARPGKNERIFKLIKFRTMSNARDKDGKLLPDDVRLNKYGRLLRSTSLDELPELINIFMGHMAFVGPRPLLVEYLPYYKPEERVRHSVRPGLTGLAQVNGRNAISWDEKLAYDVEYVSDITFLKDIKIILKTIQKTVKRSDVLVGSEFTGGKFIDQRKSLFESQGKGDYNE